jgi:hypothetical protein
MPQQPDEHAISWDFAAAMDDLLALQSSADGWRRWDELHQAAQSLVAEARASDARSLHEWLDEQAVLLIGQQLLVRSVHRDRDVRPEMQQALRDWRAHPGGGGSPAEAVAWLQGEQPALLRAWMLSHLPELIERELRRLADDDVGAAFDGFDG